MGPTGEADAAPIGRSGGDRLKSPATRALLGPKPLVALLAEPPSWDHLREHSGPTAAKAAGTRDLDTAAGELANQPKADSGTVRGAGGEAVGFGGQPVCERDALECPTGDRLDGLLRLVTVQGGGGHHQRGYGTGESVLGPTRAAALGISVGACAGWPRGHGNVGGLTRRASGR